MTNQKKGWFLRYWMFLIPTGISIIIAIVSIVRCNIAQKQYKFATSSAPSMYVKVEKFETIPLQLAIDLSSKIEVINSVEKLQRLLKSGSIALDENLIDKFESLLDDIKTKLVGDYEEAIDFYLKQSLKARIKFTNTGKVSYIVEKIEVIEKINDLLPHQHVTHQNITDNIHFSKSPPFQIPADQEISVFLEFPKAHLKNLIEAQIRSISTFQLFSNIANINLSKPYEIHAFLSNGLTISRELELNVIKVKTEGTWRRISS